MTGYVKRKINVTVQIGKGDGGSLGYDTITLNGLRVSAQVKKFGMPSYNEAEVRIWGMTLDLMNRVSTLGVQALTYQRDNKVTVYAGDAGTGGMPMAFTGTIIEAWADFNSAPDVAFVISSVTGGLDKMIPSPPSSYSGPTSVATVMSDLAGRMGKAFRNGGVPETKLADPYFPGTLMEQAEACARHADIGFQNDNDTVWIWPKGGSRGGGAQVLSAKTGMIGYPSYTSQGVRCRALYNPSVSFGGMIKIETVVTPAAGFWVVNSLCHSLESEMPGGQWASDIEGTRAGAPSMPR